MAHEPSAAVAESLILPLKREAEDRMSASDRCLRDTRYALRRAQGVQSLLRDASRGTCFGRDIQTE